MHDHPLTARLDYFRRLNPDLSYDSICVRCLQTVDRGTSHADLEKAEAEHKCCQESGVSPPYNLD
jgi:hypothetical protein